MSLAALTCEDIRIILEINDPALYDFSEVPVWDRDTLFPTEPLDVYDVADDSNAYDEPYGWFNANDYLRGFTLEIGRQSNWDDLLAGTLNLELDNTTGVFAVFGQQSLTRIRPGFLVTFECQYNGVWYPQFIGQMVEYNDSGTPGDYSVRIKAVDAFRRLQDPIEGEYHAGTDAQPALERIINLLGMAALDDLTFVGETGTATMTNYATSRSLLDEIRMTARSDCGVFFVDRDGTLLYLNRNRVYGRTPGGTIPTFGDACDGSELPYAAVDPIVADNEFGNVITVSNVSQGTDSPAAGLAVSQSSIDAYTRIPWSPSQLLICNASFVQGAADFHLALRSQAYYRINSFECYPVHDDRLWPILLGLRLYDLVRVNRRPPGDVAMLGLMIVDGMRIEGTPHLWKWTVRCSPAAGYAASVKAWDDSTSTWDSGFVWA